MEQNNWKQGLNSFDFLTNYPSQNGNNKYTSCIKIAGLPILPPLITDERKKELLEYKNNAIKVQNKLQKRLQEQNLQRIQPLPPNPLLLGDEEYPHNLSIISNSSSGIFTGTKSCNTEESIFNKSNPLYQQKDFSFRSRSPSELSHCVISEYDNNLTSTTNTSPASCSVPVIKQSNDNALLLNLNRYSSFNSCSTGSNICKLTDMYRDKYSEEQCDIISVTKNSINDISEMNKEHNVKCNKDATDKSRTNNVYQSASGKIIDNNSLLENKICTNKIDTDIANELNLLFDSNKENFGDHSNNNNCNLSSIYKHKLPENLNLSPCKSLVLKSDIFTAFGKGITVRKHDNRNKLYDKEEQISLENNSLLDFDLSFASLENNSVVVNDNSFYSNNNEDIESKDERSILDMSDPVIREYLSKHDCTVNDNSPENKQLYTNTETVTSPNLCRMGRKNSYTLEEPSPELLALIKNQHNTDKDQNFSCSNNNSSNDMKQQPGRLKRMHTWTVTSDDDGAGESGSCHKKKSINFRPFNEHTDEIITEKSNRRNSVCKQARKSWNLEEAKQQWNLQNKKNLKVVHTGSGGDNSGSTNVKRVPKQKNKRGESISLPVTETKLKGSNNIKYSKHNSHSTDCVFTLSSVVSTPLNLSPKTKIVSKKNVTKFSRLCTTSPKKQLLSEDKLSSKMFVSLPSQSGNKCLDASFSELCDISNNSTLVTLTPEKDVSSNTDNNKENSVPYSASPSVIRAVNGDCVAIKSSFECSNDDTLSLCSNITSLNFDKYSTKSDLHFDADNRITMTLSNVRSRHELELKELLRKQYEELQNLNLSSPNLIQQSPKSTDRNSSTKVSPLNLNSARSSGLDMTENDSEPLTLSLEPTRLSNEPIRTRATCSKRLNFIKTSTTLNKKCFLDYTDTERAAAVKITACAKGFLTRRLFKTDRVQQLIVSVKDSILYALNLDSENHLTPSDIELKGRLIAQMEAAMHDLQRIFSFPSANKMIIIRQDREKKKTPRTPLKPVLSSATQRVIMRKRQSMTQSQNTKSIKPRTRERQRRRSFTGFSFSSLNVPTQSRQQVNSLKKSFSTGTANKQPWK